MFKKVLAFGAVGILSAALITQTDTKLGRYVCSIWDRAEEKIDSKITNDADLKQIKKEIKAIEKDIEEAKRQLAKMNVEVKTLAKAVQQKTTDLDQAKSNLKDHATLVKQAETNKTQFVNWDGRSTNINKARELMNAEKDTVAAITKDLENTKNMLDSYEVARSETEKHYRSLLSNQKEMELAVVELEALVAQVKREQVESKYQNDNTRTSKAKESMTRLRKKIEEQREYLNISKAQVKPVKLSSADEILAGLENSDKDTNVATDRTNEK